MRTDYWATSKDMVNVPCEDVEKFGLILNYNPNIKMYRLQGKKLPLSLMGYNPHKTALVEQAVKVMSNGVGRKKNPYHWTEWK